MSHHTSAVPRNLILEPFHERRIVSCNDETLNTQSISFIDANMESMIRGPIVDGSNAVGKKIGMLKPTLLEPTIFYRCLHEEGSFSIVELFEFSDGAFILLQRNNLPFKFNYDLDSLLDRRFVIQRVDEIHMKTSYDIYIYDLNQDSKIIFSTSFQKQSFWTVVQVGVAFITTGHHSVVIDYSIISFSREGFPHLIRYSPLQRVKLCAYDRSPNTHQFIVDEDYHFLTYSVQYSALISTPFTTNKYLPKLRKVKEFIPLFDVFIPHPDAYIRHPTVYNNLWDFVLLNGKTYSTAYDSSTGISNFYRVTKQTHKCMFVLDVDSEYFPQVRKDNSSFGRFPIVCDFYNNSIIFLHTSKDFHHEILRNSHRFYDFDSNQWRTGFVTEKFRDCNFYLDGIALATLERPEHAKIIEFSFNNIHQAISFKKRSLDWQSTGSQYLLLINGNQNLINSHISHLHIIGNFVYFVSEHRFLTVQMLDDKGEILQTKEYTCNENIREVICNPYCGTEIIINQNFVMRYEIENDEFCCIKIDDSCSDPIFIDEGVIISDKTAYMLGIDGIRTFEIPEIEGFLYSPTRGILVGCTTVINHNFTMKTLQFDSSNAEFAVETRDVSVIDFFTQCEISSTFSSFGEFPHTPKEKFLPF
ncbi:hypothetical protein PCE1_000624 [Barthelona sp. PCE]